MVVTKEYLKNHLLHGYYYLDYGYISDLLVEIDSKHKVMEKYILAFDQGTTSSRALIFDREGNICTSAQKEFPQIFPKPGWVEHRPSDIWSSQVAVAAEAMSQIGLGSKHLSGIGCLLYTSDAADDLLCVDLGGRRIIKKKTDKKRPTAGKTTDYPVRH